MSTVTFNVKNLDGNHICNCNIKCGEDEYCLKHSPFTLEISGQTTVIFEKGGFKKQEVVVEDALHTENIELRETGRFTWRESLT